MFIIFFFLAFCFYDLHYLLFSLPSLNTLHLHFHLLPWFHFLYSCSHVHVRQHLRFPPGLRLVPYLFSLVTSPTAHVLHSPGFHCVPLTPQHFLETTTGERKLSANRVCVSGWQGCWEVSLRRAKVKFVELAHNIFPAARLPRKSKDL